MDVTRRTDYALRMLSELVEDPVGVVSVRTLAAENDIPYSFARSIQQSLTRAGLVENVRGSRGGMRLAVDPGKTTLREVVEAMQGEILFNCCDTAAEGDQPCARKASCRFNPIWCASARLLADYLDSVSLGEVVRGTAHPKVPERYCACP